MIPKKVAARDYTPANDMLALYEKDASGLVKEMKSVTKHAAQVLQVLRRAMGDTHGSNPLFRHTAYDAIKWASAICSLSGNTNRKGLTRRCT